MVEEMGGFRVDQFNDQGGAEAHYHGTATEIWEQCNGELDAFVDFVGTAGTFGGCARYFKEKSNGGVKCYVVEPVGASVLSEEATQQNNKQDAALIGLEHLTGPASGCGHVIQGGGYSKTLSDLKLLRDNAEYIDGYVQVSDDEAIEATRLLAKMEGIFGGCSGGANVAAAMKLLQTDVCHGSSICALICDSGLKYMSTDLWND